MWGLGESGCGVPEVEGVGFGRSRVWGSRGRGCVVREVYSVGLGRLRVGDSGK